MCKWNKYSIIFRFTFIKLQATLLSLLVVILSSTPQHDYILSVDFISSKLKREIKLKRPTTVRENLADAIKLSCTMEGKSVLKVSTQRRAKHRRKKRVSSTDFFRLSEKWCSTRWFFSRVLCLPPPSLKNERQDIIIGKNNNPEKSPCSFFVDVNIFIFQNGREFLELSSWNDNLFLSTVNIVVVASFPSPNVLRS